MDSRNQREAGVRRSQLSALQLELLGCGDKPGVEVVADGTGIRQLQVAIAVRKRPGITLSEQFKAGL